ncbi:MAG: bifunctional adenosylcobinamide kinase/adenosylcobinamide-phosphate guanylyltransferase [Desulfotomaculales bacterium]
MIPVNGRFILVTGGARSGKSAFAEKIALTSGKEVVYLATATVEDEEMARRVMLHRQRRPPSWETVEEPRNLAGVIRRHNSPSRFILIDCLALFLSNLLRETVPPSGEINSLSRAGEERVLAAVRQLGEAIRESAADVLAVTNEVGWGLVPVHPLGRIYRDLLGTANQHMAGLADTVYLVACGLPLQIKPSPKLF